MDEKQLDVILGSIYVDKVIVFLFLSQHFIINVCSHT